MITNLYKRTAPVYASLKGEVWRGKLTGGFCEARNLDYVRVQQDGEKPVVEVELKDLFETELGAVIAAIQYVHTLEQKLIERRNAL